MSLKGGAHEHTPAATTSFEPGPQTTIPTAADAVTLSEADRSRLQTFIHTGHASARMRTRAQVLLKLGEGWGLVEVCRAFDVRRNTVVQREAPPGAERLLSGADGTGMRFRLPC